MKAMNNSMKQGNQKGFTLIEALVVLGIFAAFVGAVVALSGGTSASQVAQTESRVINSAASKIKSIYEGRPNYAGLDQGVANDLQVFSESMGNPAVNTFDGQIDVLTPPTAPKGTAPNGARQFQIDWPNVSEDVCPELASMQQTNAIGIEVDGTTVFNAGVAPLDIGAVAANCGPGVTVSFIYGK